MADTLEIFGDEFTNVTGIKATDDNNQIKTYIRPQGTKSITQNGTGIDVTNYASVDVSVSGGGGSSGLEYETGTWTPSEDIVSYDIQLANTHTVAPSFYVIADCSNNYSGLTHMPINITFLESYQMVGGIFYRGETTPTYGGVFSQKIGPNASQFSTSLISFLYPSTASQSSNTGCARYWATETTIKAYSGYDTYSFRAGRTYKWIAVWAPTT